jgi:2-iminobutanoate/2-iminopropanoate deaminase
MKYPEAIGPYSAYQIHNGFLYSSGQLGIDPESGELVADITTQTRRSLYNIGAILEENGLSYKDVIKTTIFLKDMNDFTLVNGIYAEFFVEPYPARSCIQVARLPKDGLIEIEIIAKIDK